MTEAREKPAVNAYLALGSNLGDRLGTLREARGELGRTPGVQVVGSSSLYETDPVGGPPGQPLYYNAVLAVASTLGAGELLRRCLEVEERFGRRRRERWGARTLDIDLLFYGSELSDRPELVLPHPRLHLRRFVLVPLAELAPELPHPRIGRTIRELLAELPEADGVRRILETW